MIPIDNHTEFIRSLSISQSRPLFLNLGSFEICGWLGTLKFIILKLRRLRNTGPRPYINVTVSKQLPVVKSQINKARRATEHQLWCTVQSIWLLEVQKKKYDLTAQIIIIFPLYQDRVAKILYPLGKKKKKIEMQNLFRQTECAGAEENRTNIQEKNFSVQCFSAPRPLWKSSELIIWPQINHYAKQTIQEREPRWKSSLE